MSFSRRRGLRARGPTLAAVLVAGLVWAPVAWCHPNPKSRQFPAACAGLWTRIVNVVKWNPRYKTIRMDAKKHLVAFSVGDAGKPSEGELSATPRRVGKAQCSLEVGFVTASIGGTGLLRAEAVLFAQMVKMETASEVEPAPVGSRLSPRCRPAWRALVDVANAYTTYKPVAVDQKRHSLSLTLVGQPFVGRVEAPKDGTCRLTIKLAPGAGTIGPPVREQVRKLTERVKQQERLNRLKRNQ